MPEEYSECGEAIVFAFVCVYIGPFVMNTAEQIRQTITDYSNGKNGFERAPGWESEIGKARMF